MKNLKKVLAMVLAFACTFTMFAGAKVFEDVPAGSDYSEAITMLSDLGIIKGKTETTYAPDETITREEACTLIARLLTGEQDVVGFENAQNFTDTKYSWAKSAIGYCVVNGIVVGDGNGKFRPMDKITDAEFVTMVVRAMGYETADMKQNYPHSYLSAAMARGLLDNVNMVATSDALRGENAQIIFNALFAQYKRYGDDQKTLAEAVWGLQQAYVESEEVKENDSNQNTTPLPHDKYCNSHTWVIIGEAQDDPNAFLAYPIDDKKPVELFKSSESKQQYLPYKFKYEGDMSNIEALKGYKVELFGKKEHGKGTVEKEQINFTNWSIQSIKTVKGQAVHEYNASMADKKAEDGTIDLGETQLSLENVAVNNARNVQSTDEVKFVDTFMGDKLNTISIKDEKSVEKALNVRNGNQYRLMDWDGDNEIDWVVVDQANYYKVESATSKRVTVTSMKDNKDMDSRATSETATWKLDEEEKIGENNLKKDIRIKYEVPEGLKEGDIVEVTYKVSGAKNSQLITATVTVVDAENQKLEKVGSRDGLTLTFGDAELKVAQNANKGNVIEPANPQTYKGFNGEELGTEFALWQDRNGFIVHSDYATDVSDYMMVLNTGDGNSSSTNNRKLAAVDIKTQDNSVKNDVQVAEDLRILNADGSDMGAYSESSRTFDESKVVGNVFKYWTNEDGIITKMQAVIDVTSDAIKNKDTVHSGDTYTYNEKTYVLSDTNGNHTDLEDARVIFAVKSHGDTTNTGNTGYIKSDANGDLSVDSDDVLALTPDDLATIDNKDIISKPLDDGGVDPLKLVHHNTWLNNSNYRVGHAASIASIDKNSDAIGAVLGVDDFNKFGAQNVKVGLVTNVSERNGGIVEIDVASGGKVETFSTAEKTKFSDVVKVFDGSTDIGVAGVDSKINAQNNGIFHDEKLSTVINQGGMYAEVTTDADGKLVRVVFMDDDNNGEENLITGHYYKVTRNVVTGLKDNKGIKYQNNLDNEPAMYAGEDKLFSVDYLNQSYGELANDANYYEIDAEPTRHDKAYNGTRMSVKTGFDNLRLGDITTIEAGDINYQPIYNTTFDDAYAVADIATKIGGDVVAVYSFKGDLDEVEANNVALVSAKIDQDFVNDNNVKAGDTLNVTVRYMDNKSNAKVSGIRVYDANGKDVTVGNGFTVNGSVSANTWTGTLAISESVALGNYTIKGVLDNGTVCDAGQLTFKVNASTNKYQVAGLNFGAYTGHADDAANGGYKVTNKLTTAGSNNSFILNATGNVTLAAAAEITNGVPNLTKNNIRISYNGGTEVAPTAVEYKGHGFYVVTVAEDLNSEAIKNANIAVRVIADGNVVVADSLKPVVSNGVANGAGDGGTTPETGTPAANKSKVGSVTEDGTFVESGKVSKSAENIFVQICDEAGQPIVGLKDQTFTLIAGTKEVSITGISPVFNSKAEETGVYDIAIDPRALDNMAGKKLTLKLGNVVLGTWDIVDGSADPGVVGNKVKNVAFASINGEDAQQSGALSLSEDGKTFGVYVEGEARTKSGSALTGMEQTGSFTVTSDKGLGTEKVQQATVQAVENQPGFYLLTVAESLANASTVEVTAKALATDTDSAPVQAEDVVSEKVQVADFVPMVYNTDDEYTADYGLDKEGKFAFHKHTAADLGFTDGMEDISSSGAYFLVQYNEALKDSTAWIGDEDTDVSNNGTVNTKLGRKIKKYDSSNPLPRLTDENSFPVLAGKDTSVTFEIYHSTSGNWSEEKTLVSKKTFNFSNVTQDKYYNKITLKGEGSDSYTITPFAKGLTIGVTYQNDGTADEKSRAAAKMSLLQSKIQEGELGFELNSEPATVKTTIEGTGAATKLVVNIDNAKVDDKVTIVATDGRAFILPEEIEYTLEGSELSKLEIVGSPKANEKVLTIDCGLTGEALDAFVAELSAANSTETKLLKILTGSDGSVNQEMQIDKIEVSGDKIQVTLNAGLTESNKVKASVEKTSLYKAKQSAEVSVGAAG